MKKYPSKKLSFEPQWFTVAIFFLAGIFLGGLGLFIWLFNGQGLFGLQKIHPPHSDTYQFINPLLAVDTLEKKEFFENAVLKNRLSLAIEKSKRKKDVLDAAVYFRDIESGRWAGVNEEMKFSPGRILKVPLMISIFKNAEANASLLDKKLRYADTYGEMSTSSDEYLTFGASYTTEQLVEQMIINDDDIAANILFDNSDKNGLNDVYSDLSVPYREDKINDDYLTVKSYSLFFRILYNATYLNRDSSEKILDILSRTSQTAGIVTGLPNTLVVAHKYRTRSFIRNDRTLRESHDCGIVYFPNHPYLLCVMGIGQSEDAIDRLFGEMSGIAYNNMVNTYRFVQ